MLRSRDVSLRPTVMNSSSIDGGGLARVFGPEIRLGRLRSAVDAFHGDGTCPAIGPLDPSGLQPAGFKIDMTVLPSRKEPSVFSTIVVGTDGSPDAEQALRAAAKLAGLDPATNVHVVAAFRPIPSPQLQSISRSLPDEFQGLVHATMHVDATIDSARSVMKAAGIEADYHEVNNYPTEAILDAVEAQEADLVVVGSRGEGTAKRLLHGSVSTNVMHHAPCAVLVVHDNQ